MSAETLPMLISVRRLGEILRRLPERTLRTERGPLLRVHVNGHHISGVRSWVAEDAAYHARNWYGRLPSPSKPGHSLELHADGFVLVWPDAAPARLWWPEGVTTADLLPSAEEDEEAERRRLVERYGLVPPPPKPSKVPIALRYSKRKAERRAAREAEARADRVWSERRALARRIREMRADPILRPLVRRYGFRVVSAHLAILEDERSRWQRRREAAQERYVPRPDAKHPPRNFRMKIGEGVAASYRTTCHPDPAAAERRARAIREAEKLQLPFTLVSEAEA